MIDTTAHQNLCIKHYTGKGDFKQDGLREYAAYRDLGVSEATGGAAQVHVIKMIPPCTDKVRDRHIHVLNFQFFYVLRGWIKIDFEGRGEVVLKAGDSCLMPPKIIHTVLDYSDDLENLEIVMPAKFDTIEA